MWTGRVGKGGVIFPESKKSCRVAGIQASQIPKDVVIRPHELAKFSTYYKAVAASSAFIDKSADKHLGFKVQCSLQHQLQWSKKWLCKVACRIWEVFENCRTIFQPFRNRAIGTTDYMNQEYVIRSCSGLISFHEQCPRGMGSRSFWSLNDSNSNHCSAGGEGAGGKAGESRLA